MSTPGGAPADGPRWYSAAQVAELLGISENTARRLIDAGDLPSRRFGRLVRVPESALVPTSTSPATPAEGTAP